VNGLSLSYEWHDNDLISLIVKVSNGSFAGAAQVYVMPEAPEDLARQIGKGPYNPGESCELALGNFDPECAGGGAKLRIVPLDKQGHLACTVSLHDGHPGSGLQEQVTCVFLTQPAMLDEFVGQLLRFKTEYGHEAVFQMAT
jgi:hypothetical protein